MKFIYVLVLLISDEPTTISMLKEFKSIDECTKSMTAIVDQSKDKEVAANRLGCVTIVLTDKKGNAI